MGEFRPNPNTDNRIFLAKQQNSLPFVTDTLYGNDLLKTQNSNFRTPIVNGTRNGVPPDQPVDYFLQRHFQANPYVRGMHPYTSNMMVDIAPSVYNTNPLAGVGGYEKNLASFNGTRPLATTLDEPQEIAQRLYEDEFKLSLNNPLSMQFTVNHANVDKRARGDMYDAFRLGLEKNDEGVEPDYDLVLQSKRQKGYNGQGVLPGGAENEGKISTYFENQKPLRTGDFNKGVNKVISNMTITPAPHADMATQVGNDRNDVIGGGTNFFGPGGGGWGDDDDTGGGGGGRNLVQVFQDLPELIEVKPPRARRDILNGDEVSILTGPSDGMESLSFRSVTSESSDKSYSSLLNELENMVQSSPEVNRLLAISRNTNSGTTRGMNSGYNVQRSGQPTSVARLSGAAVQHGGEFSPIGNIRNDLMETSSNKYRKEPQRTPLIGDNVRVPRGLFMTNMSGGRYDSATGRGEYMMLYNPQRTPNLVQL